jgi:magnesium-transporting ATPase (P-type)
MLEATIIVQLVVGERLEALVVALLLAFNSVLSLIQETRSEKALELLKRRLAPNASVLRDGQWKVLPAAAASLAAQALARKDVLLTRLTAVHEAASVDVLCSDKTGTLTRNELAISSIVPAPAVKRRDVLSLAAIASSEGGGDPVDAAIRAAAVRESTMDGRYRRLSFTPFDPALKMAQAVAETERHHVVSVAKGAFDTIARMAETAPEIRAAAEALEKEGVRVLIGAIIRDGRTRIGTGHRPSQCLQ